jgi:hypothetical protein
MRIFLREGSNNWHIRFTWPPESKKRRTVSCETDSKRKATQDAGEIRKKWIENFEKGGGLTVKDLRRLHEDWCRHNQGRNDRHIDSEIGPHWNSLESFFDQVSAINADTLDEYVRTKLAEVNAQGKPRYNRWTIRRHFTSLKKGLAQARRKKLSTLIIPDEDWPETPKKPKGGKRGEGGSSHKYGTDQIRSILLCLNGHAFDAAMIMAVTGCRAEESERLTLADFTPRHDLVGVCGTLFVRGGEDPDRTVAIPEAMRALVGRALEGRRMAVKHRRAYQTAAELAGYGRRAHRRDFRAAFAHAVMRVDPAGAVQTMGHSTARLGTTGVYLSWTDADRAAVARTVWAALAPDGIAEKVATEVAQSGYMRARPRSGKPIDQLETASKTHLRVVAG